MGEWRFGTGMAVNAFTCYPFFTLISPSAAFDASVELKGKASCARRGQGSPGSRSVKEDMRNTYETFRVGHKEWMGCVRVCVNVCVRVRACVCTCGLVCTCVCLFVCLPVPLNYYLNASNYIYFSSLIKLCEFTRNYSRITPIHLSFRDFGYIISF